MSIKTLSTTLKVAAPISRLVHMMVLLAGLAFSLAAHAQPSADLRVTHSPSADAVVVFDSLTYYLNVSNAGPDNSQGVELVVNMPGTVSVDMMTTSQGSCAVAGVNVTCPIGAIAAGDDVSVQIQATTQFVGDISARASVSALTPDPDASDNMAEANVVVVASAAALPTPSIPVMSPWAILAMILSLLSVAAMTIRRAASGPAAKYR